MGALQNRGNDGAIYPELKFLRRGFRPWPITSLDAIPALRPQLCDDAEIASQSTLQRENCGGGDQGRHGL